MNYLTIYVRAIPINLKRSVLRMLCRQFSSKHFLGKRTSFIERVNQLLGPGNRAGKSNGRCSQLICVWRYWC